jgi:GNAT superfamily N-acetyltransferase
VEILRPYDEADAAACCEVINSALPAMDGLNAAALALVRAKNVPTMLGAELAGAYTLVVEEQGRVCGVGCLSDAEIKRLYVIPAAHHRGIGRRLVAALEHEALRRDLAELRVDASPSSVGFYERLGFVSVRMDGFTRAEATFRFVLMTKRITAA